MVYAIIIILYTFMADADKRVTKGPIKRGRAAGIDVEY